MRNLKLLRNKLIKLENKTLDEFSFLCSDSASKTCYIVSKKNIYKAFYEKDSTLQEIFDVEKIYNIEIIIDAEFSIILNCVTAVCTNGILLSVDLENKEVVVIGSTDNEIISSCWSPDQDVLALVTAELFVILTTPDFDELSSADLKDSHQNEFLNVGWGKKETQFHGSEGKSAAKLVSKIQSLICDWDDRSVSISWRGDGQMFCVNYVDSATHSRMFKIISRDGAILYKNEIVEGLENTLSWKPTGNLIASSQRLSNKHNIIFFEKNGLHHGDFTLPFAHNEVLIKRIDWNCDSSILSLWLKPFASNYSIIQLWQTKNYHWYLKKEFKFDKIIDCKWDVEISSLCYILEPNGIRILEFIDCLNLSTGLLSCDNSVVAVIDGKKLLLTPFRQKIIPPPMSCYSLKFSETINTVFFAPVMEDETIDSVKYLPTNECKFIDTSDIYVNNSNNFCVFHSQNLLSFFTCDDHSALNDRSNKINLDPHSSNGFKNNVKMHEVRTQLKIELDTTVDFKLSSINLYHFCWINKNIILASGILDSKNCILTLNLDFKNCQAIVKGKVKIMGEIISITSINLGSFVCIQMNDGTLLEYDYLNSQVLPWCVDGIEQKFPVRCEQIKLCLIEKNIVPLGRTIRNRLYFGNTQLLSNCTSFVVHNDHILITTSSHSLLTVPKKLKEVLSLSDGIKEKFSEIGTRRLERGSKIITAVSHHTKVILQMPRGNLEAIHPRPLAIQLIQNLLSVQNYYAAIDLMRRQRIDMNLIHDHNPKEFFDNIELFVKSVDNSQWLDIFIASLRNEDVTQTSYSSNYKEKIIDTSNKIDFICESLIKTLIKLDESRYLLPIISTYVKSSKAETPLALQKLKNMRDSTENFAVTFDEGLKHLLYVADINDLCNEALGTYDFDIAMMVYEKSQKDPKEYLPFLNSLKCLEDNYREYKINVHLKRYDKALKFVNKFQKDEYNSEILELIKKQNLYGLSLNILNKNSELNRLVTSSYADHLSSKGYFSEAGALYSRACLFRKALVAYEHAGNWKKVLSTAYQLKLEKEEIKKISMSLIEALENKNDHAGAAHIYERYIQMEEEAVESYCKAYLWEDAYLLATRHNRLDLIETNIKPSALERSLDRHEVINNKTNRFTTLFQRLCAVRENKKTEYISNLEQGGDENFENELWSDASTVTGISYQRSNVSRATNASNRTYRSSKNKRKLERKKYSDREGSPFEDLGIIVLIHDMMTSIAALANEISDLNRILILFSEDEKAKSLQTNLEKIIEEMKSKQKTIWPNCRAQDENDQEFGPNMTTASVLTQLQGKTEKAENYLVQRMNILEPNFRISPDLNSVTGWKLFTLK